MGLKLDKWTNAATRRRILMFSAAAFQTWIAAQYMLKILPEHGGNNLEVATLALFVILFTWISLGFWTAVAGFFALTLGKGDYNISKVLEEAGDCEIPLTAIVTPICNEDTARVFAGLRATYESLKSSGKLDRFEFFILSDSKDPEVQVREEEAWARWCRESGDYKRIHYRLRRTSIKRKTGNLADFCRRWGDNYRYMIVFDADSFMTGTTLVNMVRAMEVRQNVGIIQTAPMSVNRNSFYARMQQFGNHVYGPLFAAGLNFWQMGDGYYWGHNAIIRLKPFIEHCALERLPGKPPMGGEILSHDFVEAAYIRRAGYEVWLAHDMPGSYEEPPPTLLDELKRDRRWSQGNLQHLRLINGWGLRTTHRVMFFYGIMAYGSSLLWLIMLGLSTLDVAIRSKQEVSYFPEHYTLFPNWPEAWHPEWVLGLLAATATLLFLPKFLGILYISLKAKTARQFGGTLHLTLSVMLESIMSILLAPVRMLFHSRYVLMTLLGRDVKWGTQQREDSLTGWGEAILQHGFGTLLAIGWAAYVFYIDPNYLAWISPIIVALLVAVPVSVFTSYRTIGRWLRSKRIFLIPAETEPDPVVDDLHRFIDEFKGKPRLSFEDAVVNPAIHALHLSLLPQRKNQPEPTRERLVALREKALHEGAAALSVKEQSQLLRDAESMTWLHRQAWYANPPLPHWPLTQAQ